MSIPYLRLVPLKRRVPAIGKPSLLERLDRNRHQLFRGICIDADDDAYDDWIYGDILQTKKSKDKKGVESSKRYFIAILDEDDVPFVREVDPLSIGQYMITWTRDGTVFHLFEGDIIETDVTKPMDVCCRVAYTDGKLDFIPFTKGDWSAPLPNRFVELKERAEMERLTSIVIRPELDGKLYHIGNIYDNPELIGSKIKEEN